MNFYFPLNYLIVFGLNNRFNLNYEHTCRIASILHSLVSVIGSILYLTNSICLENTDVIISYNISYILTDLYLYIFNKISTKDINVMLFHHISFLLVIYYHKLNPTFYFIGLLSEGSTIFLNIRWFSIKKIIFKNIQTHTIIFWWSFLIFRIINMSYLTYLMLIANKINYILLLSPFLLLNFGWFYLMTDKLFINKIEYNSNE